MSGNGDLADFLQKGKAPEDEEEVLERREEIEAPVEPIRYSTLRRLVTDQEHRTVISFGGEKSS